MFNVKDKKVLVVGLGASGYAAAELSARKGAVVGITESSDNKEVRERLSRLSRYHPRYEIGRHTEEFCGSADLVVTSPGIDPGVLPLKVARKEGKEIIGELELAYRFCEAPIIAVTGTNGKSTTTELIGNIISRSGRHVVVCGNIGNPLSGEVNRLKKDSIAVVEVSSFQMETVKEFRPHIGVLLNVAEDHYERHGDFETYKAEKFRMFGNQSESDWAVLHSDLKGDPIARRIRAQKIFFGGPGSEASVEGGRVIMDIGGAGRVVIEEKDIPIRGVHNMENVACAILVSRIMGVEDRHAHEGVANFKGLSHRFERVTELGGVEFIDDSKATNIDATRRALESIDRKVVLIAGGRDKGGDYEAIFDLVKEKVKAMVVIGEASEKIKSAFSGAVTVVSAGDMSEAVKMSMREASEGEAVLLSPMCSSFDMFTDYKHRGRVFREEVERL